MTTREKHNNENSFSNKYCSIQCPWKGHNYVFAAECSTVLCIFLVSLLCRAYPLYYDKIWN